MKFTVLNIGVLLSVLTVWAITPANEYKSDIEKVKATITKSKIGFTIAYKMYPNGNSNNLIQEYKGNYYVWDDLMAYKSTDHELIMAKDTRITIDHEDKVVTINKYNKRQYAEFVKDMYKSFEDSAMLNLATYKLLESSSTQKKWLVQYASGIGNLESAVVDIKLPDYHITKVVLQYGASFASIYGEAPDGVSLNDKPRLEVIYSQYKKLTVTEKEKLFNTDLIVRSYKSGKGVLQANYKNYKLANYYTYKP